MAYNDRVERSGTSRTAREIPETVAKDILKDVVEDSAALQLGKTFRMPAYKHRMRVLKAFADAFWLNGVTDAPGGAGDGSQAAKDSAMKQTTKLEWDNVYLTPEEIAVLVPVPDAWMDDSDLAWEEIKSEIRRAFAKKIDLAILFGDGNVPSTFGVGLTQAAVTAGNTLTEGDGTSEGTWGASGNDLALDIAALGELMANKGYDVNGFASGPAFDWRLLRQRDANGNPILNQLDGNFSLYGRPLKMVTNGGFDKTEATLITGDWEKLVIGIRQDITFQVFDQAPIFDTSGNLIYNPMQQDGKVLRAVMRLGYAVPNHVKVLGGTFPFAVLRPENASS